MSRKILFITKNVDSASTRYRAQGYRDYLAAAGWEPIYVEGDGGMRHRLGLLRRAQRADVTVVTRKTFTAVYRRALRAAAGRLVFDFDDSIFTSPKKPSPWRQRRFASMVRICDQIWAGNSYLAEQAGKHNPSVLILPTSVEFSSYAASVEKPASALDLVWIGSTVSRPYLEESLPALELAARRLPNLRLKVVADFDLQSHVFPILSKPWSSATEVSDLASAHVGVAPMTDDPWARGKCGLKVLQYMAAGLPVVASPVGANKDIVVDGVTGFLAREPQEWVEALSRLAADAGLRRSLGEAARELVEKEFSYAANSRKMITSLAGLVAHE
jgi:glycosyltransferase involved in cell wall biosynthesis